MTAETDARRSSRRLVTSVAAALVLVAAIVTAVVLLTNGSDEPGDADAEQACAILDRLPDDLTIDHIQADETLGYRLSAIESLAAAAEIEDNRYADLAKHAATLQKRIRAMFRVPESVWRDLQEACDDLG